MYFELPDCRRCCLCVPLRHGILIFGYLKLAFTFLTIGVDIWLDMVYPQSVNTHTVVMYRGVGMYTHLWFAYSLLAVEIIFNVMLIVGAHMKSIGLMRLYYYFGIVTTVASFLVFIALRANEKYQTFPDPFEWCLAFSGLAIQCYLLLLIRTELNKLEYLAGPFRYVNHATEIAHPPHPDPSKLEFS